MIKLSKWLIPQLLIFLMLGFETKILIAFLWIIFHEIFHYFVAKNLGLRVENFKIHPLGTTVELSEFDELSLKEELIICLSGPIANLMMAATFFVLNGSIGGYFVQNSMEVNLVLGIFNLIPAYPLDGARIIRIILSTKMLYKKAYNITAYLSYIIAAIFLACFIFLTSIHKLNLSLVFSSLFIIFITYKEKGRVMYIIMADIIKKRKRFLKKRYIDNKDISVYHKLGLVNVLGLVDKNKFNTFYVLDGEMKLLLIIHEDELIEALKLYGNISLEEYIGIKNSWAEKY